VTTTEESPATTASPAFGFIGGDPCVDFVNTVDSWPATPDVDHLRTYADLLEWTVQAGLIDALTQDVLQRASSQDEAAAERILRRARALRTHLRGILSAVASDRPPKEREIAAIAAVARKAAAHSDLACHDGRYAWALDRSYRDHLEWPLWELARSTIFLLTSDALRHVRECASDRCQWMFIDRSRNHSRRWCDMAVCGNRAKARRNYARRKARRSEDGE
jgi:predicted RNA-binding Zn ribbon-like protein